MNSHTSATAEVRVFCESVSDSTTKTISLLKAIEQTVDWLAWLQNRARADTVFADKAAENIKICDRVKIIDLDGTIVSLVEEAEGGLERLYQLLINKRAAAMKAPELQGDHKTAVVDEYTPAISVIANLHNSMTELKWAIGEHDSDLEKSTGQAISDREQLKNYITSL